MELLRHCILQVNTICSERKSDDPREIEEVNEYSGTCFRVVPDFLSKTPFYSDDKLYFVTNFHVCDDADNRTVFIRTAAMGKSMFTAFVEAVVPKLDVAILSVQRGDDHIRWFLPESADVHLDKLKLATLYPKRISSKSKKVSTIGFPSGLENQLSSGWLAGRGSDDEEMLQLNMSFIGDDCELPSGSGSLVSVVLNPVGGEQGDESIISINDNSVFRDKDNNEISISNLSTGSSHDARIVFP